MRRDKAGRRAVRAFSAPGRGQQRRRRVTARARQRRHPTRARHSPRQRAPPRAGAGGCDCAPPPCRSACQPRNHSASSPIRWRGRQPPADDVTTIVPGCELPGNEPIGADGRFARMPQGPGCVRQGVHLRMRALRCQHHPPAVAALREEPLTRCYLAITDRLSLRRAVVFKLREEAGVSR